EHVPGVLVKLGRMQQRLRRNAADVEAGAAVRRALLDHRGLESKLRRANGADIASRAGADDDEVVGHAIVSKFVARTINPSDCSQPRAGKPNNGAIYPII